MRRAWWIAGVAVGLCGVMRGQGQAPVETLAEQIQAMVAEPAVARAHWGVMVTAMDGTAIYGMNEGQLFQPASNAKLFTTAAALALLGPQKTFETAIKAHGDIVEGRLDGDLVLVGGGDANLSGRELPYIAPGLRSKATVPVPPTNPLRHLEEMADQVVATGLKTVTGDVIGDDTLFPWQPYAEDWVIDDAVWGYGAPVSALSVADNQLRLTITPAKRAGVAASVVLEQGVPYYTVEATVATDPAKAKDASLQVERLPGSRVVRVYGTIAADADVDVEEIAIEDPAEYAAMALKAMLEARGVSVEGKALAKHRSTTDAAGFLDKLKQPGQEEAVVSGGIEGGSCLFTPIERSVTSVVLAKHVSPKLGDDVTVTNKVSQNLHAELLLHQLGRRPFCGRGSTVQGARMVKAFLLHAGVEEDEFVFFDGSGLSGHDLVTPRAITKLLHYASTQAWFGAYRASLPVGGVDGGLLNRFTAVGLKGHVFAKTGTLGEARALSGYLECKSGKTVIFSVMVGNHAPGTAADKDVMDRIVAAIAAAE